MTRGRFVRMLGALMLATIPTAMAGPGRSRVGEQVSLEMCRSDQPDRPRFVETAGRRGLNVLVARFDGKSPYAAEVGAELGQTLESALPSYVNRLIDPAARKAGLNPADVQVKYASCAVSRASARAIGQAWGAHVVAHPHHPLHPPDFGSVDLTDYEDLDVLPFEVGARRGDPCRSLARPGAVPRAVEQGRAGANAR
jgi:hypothetical protein